MLLLLYLFFVVPAVAPAPDVTVSGTVVDAQTGAPLADCNVIITPGKNGVATNTDGEFSCKLDYGAYTARFSYLGYEDNQLTFELSQTQTNLDLTIKMQPQPLLGEAVTVFGEKQASPTVQRLKQRDIKRMPTVYGDALRSIKILPGVTSNNELSTTYNVRGGNYDENLIYLNGFEIYRPTLLRQGVEENQSVINPDLVEQLSFHGAAFPARFGDKLASALEVDYAGASSRRLTGVVRADVLNIGLALRHRIGRLNWALGVRYANPSSFVDNLQTSGDYRPRFADVQLLLNYEFNRSTQLELFLLNANNEFDLTPDVWRGNIAFSTTDVRGVDIEWDGERRYSFDARLVGLRFKQEVSNSSRLSLAISGFENSEDENTDLTGDIFYIPDAFAPQRNRSFLKSRTERAGNRLDLRGYEINPELQSQAGKHTLEIGAGVRVVEMASRLDELTFEQGDNTDVELPRVQQVERDETFTSLSAFVQDRIALHPRLNANLGLRLLHYDFTGETLLSPRASLSYLPASTHSVNFGVGYYYQPPFVHELRDKPEGSDANLKSQRAIHAIVGWEHQITPRLTTRVETYYKRLDDIIPYHQDQLRLVYGDSNSHEGYAYGLDVLLNGEVVPGVNSWLSYSYLKSREREKGSENTVRRLLDQTHTFRFFLQDKMPRFPNVQAHIRILFGSGFLLHPRRAVTDPASGRSFLEVDFDRREELRYYFRMDLGFTANIKIGQHRSLLITGEILNVWNVLNIADYTWFDVPQLSRQPRRIPQVFTRRFFNIGVEVGL